MVEGAGRGHVGQARLSSQRRLHRGEQSHERQSHHHRQHHSRYEHPEEELVVELQVHVEQDDDGELETGEEEQDNRRPDGRRFAQAHRVQDKDELDDGDDEQQYRNEDVLLEGRVPAAAVFRFVRCCHSGSVLQAIPGLPISCLSQNGSVFGIFQSCKF